MYATNPAVQTVGYYASRPMSCPCRRLRLLFTVPSFDRGIWGSVFRIIFLPRHKKDVRVCRREKRGEEAPNNTFDEIATAAICIWTCCLHMQCWAP